MSKKIIEKGTVQETLLIPLYGRKRAMDLYPGNFHDMDCQKIFEQVEMSHEKKGLMEKPGAIMAATRQYDMPATSMIYPGLNRLIFTRRMESSSLLPAYSIISKQNR